MLVFFLFFSFLFVFVSASIHANKNLIFEHKRGLKQVCASTPSLLASMKRFVSVKNLLKSRFLLVLSNIVCINVEIVTQCKTWNCTLPILTHM